MKNMKRILLTMVAALLLVVMSVAGTLAYLTSTSDQVINTFTIGKVNITLDEAKTDEYGVEDTTAARVIENEYKLIPGHTYTKDPEVHVLAESEPSYIYVKITNEMASYMVAGCIENQMAAHGWKLLPGYEAEGIYYYVDLSVTEDNVDASIVDARNAAITLPVFDTITLLDTLTDAEIQVAATKTIVIQAYALQADGFEDGDDVGISAVEEAYPQAESSWPANAPASSEEDDNATGE